MSKGRAGGPTYPQTFAVAASQLRPPATDVYINTAFAPKTYSQRYAWEYLKQATIVHEALHNVTGKNDDDLESLLTQNPKTRQRES